MIINNDIFKQILSYLTEYQINVVLFDKPDIRGITTLEQFERFKHLDRFHSSFHFYHIKKMIHYPDNYTVIRKLMNDIDIDMLQGVDLPIITDYYNMDLIEQGARPSIKLLNEYLVEFKERGILDWEYVKKNKEKINKDLHRYIEFSV